MIDETEAIVLRSMDFSDTSKIVTLYSKKFGKIKVMAKGAKRANNKFGASLQPMTYSSIVFYNKPSRDLHLLSKSEIVEPFISLHSDSEKMFIGLALIELLNMAMHDEEENPAMFELVVQAMKEMNTAEKNSINIFLAFQLRLCALFGFRLNLSACTRCGKETEETHSLHGYLQLTNGTYCCSFCNEETGSGGVKISSGAIRSMQWLGETPLQNLTPLSVSSSMRDEILSVLQLYLRYHIEGIRTLNSLSLLYSQR